MPLLLRYLDNSAHLLQNLQTWVPLSIPEWRWHDFQRFLKWNNFWLCISYWNVDGLNPRNRAFNFFNSQNHFSVKPFSWFSSRKCPLRFFSHHWDLSKNNFLYIRSVFYAPPWWKISRYDFVSCLRVLTPFSPQMSKHFILLELFQLCWSPFCPCVTLLTNEFCGWTRKDFVFNPMKTRRECSTAQKCSSGNLVEN